MVGKAMDRTGGGQPVFGVALAKLEEQESLFQRRQDPGGNLADLAGLRQTYCTVPSLTGCGKKMGENRRDQPTGEGISPIPASPASPASPPPSALQVHAIQPQKLDNLTQQQPPSFYGYKVLVHSTLLLPSIINSKNLNTSYDLETLCQTAMATSKTD
jgi:hypothetical protein